VNTEPSTLLTSGVQSDGSVVQYAYPYPVPPSLTQSTGLALTPRPLARHRPHSYVEQWTASVQQALPSQTALTVTYLGAHGVHLFRRGYTNLIDPTTNTRDRYVEARTENSHHSREFRNNHIDRQLCRPSRHRNTASAGILSALQLLAPRREERFGSSARTLLLALFNEAACANVPAARTRSVRETVSAAHLSPYCIASIKTQQPTCESAR
jgi:hypothetical protein